MGWFYGIDGLVLRIEGMQLFFDVDRSTAWGGGTDIIGLDR
jgi:hypothetical protein